MHFWATTSHQDDSVLVNRGIVHSILRDTKLALADFDLAIGVIYDLYKKKHMFFFIFHALY